MGVDCIGICFFMNLKFVNCKLCMKFVITYHDCNLCCKNHCYHPQRRREKLFVHIVFDHSTFS